MNCSHEKLMRDVTNLEISFDANWLLESLLDRYRWPGQYIGGQPTIEVILENGDKTNCLFGDDGYLVPEVAISYYNQGYTLLFSRIQRLHNSLRSLSDLINAHVRDEVNMNIYFGTGGKSISFPLHTHDYPVIVKNVQGTSEWIIGDETEVVANQEAVYFGAEVPHAVTKILTPKLSITCSMVGYAN